MVCVKCKASVGCSCQLREGMCPSCYSASLQANNPNNPNTINVQPKTK